MRDTVASSEQRTLVTQTIAQQLSVSNVFLMCCLVFREVIKNHLLKSHLRQIFFSSTNEKSSAIEATQ